MLGGIFLHAKKETAIDSLFLNRRLPILPGRLQPSTFGVCMLNCCVRNGNRWGHAAIITRYTTVSYIGCTHKTSQKHSDIRTCN